MHQPRRPTSRSPSRCMLGAIVVQGATDPDEYFVIVVKAGGVLGS